MLKLLTHEELRKQMQPGEVEVWRDTEDSPYTPEQIDAGIARYNAAATKEAPVVIDHDNPPKDPRTGPQYGRLESLRRIGAHTIAKLSDVADDLKDWAATHLRGRSMEWYEDHDGKPGELFPRALAFVGAQPPAIKGMAPAQFHEKPGVKIGAQLANDPVIRLEEEDVHPKRRKTDVAPPLGEDGKVIQVAGFSEAQVSALTSVVTAALAPMIERVKTLETREQDNATSAFERRIAQFSEGLVKGGIVEPAKVAGEVSFARSLRGSVVTVGDAKVDGAEAYIEKRLADTPTVPLGEARLGRIATFSEGPVKGEDGKEHAVLIPEGTSPEKRAEIEAIARHARKNGMTFGAAQIDLEQRESVEA